MQSASDIQHKFAVGDRVFQLGFIDPFVVRTAKTIRKRDKQPLYDLIRDDKQIEQGCPERMLRETPMHNDGKDTPMID
jgi:hypothetical protein